MAGEVVSILTDRFLADDVRTHMPPKEKIQGRTSVATTNAVDVVSLRRDTFAGISPVCVQQVSDDLDMMR